MPRQLDVRPMHPSMGKSNTRRSGVHIRRHAARILQRAQLEPNSLTATDVIQLQRTIGNRAVRQLLAQRNNASNPTGNGSPISSAPSSHTNVTDGVFVQRKSHKRYERIWQYAHISNLLSTTDVQMLRNWVVPLKGKADKAVLNLISLTSWHNKKSVPIDRKRKIQILLWKELLGNGFDVAAASSLRDTLLTLSDQKLDQRLGISDERDVGTLLLGESEASESEKKEETDTLHPIKKMEDVYWGEPPLSEEQGRQLLTRINQRDRDVVDIMQNGLHRSAETFEPSPKFIFGWEWGLGKLHDSEEVVLIHGQSKGVEWGPYLKHVSPLAHAHPSGADREINRDESKKLKLVPWNDLITKAGRERLTVFPSTMDVVFCAEQKVKAHSVYTPYFILPNQQDEGRLYVFDTSASLDVPMKARSYLTFEILDARQDRSEENHYYCTLVAKAGDKEIWRQKDVLADYSKGGHSTLTF